MGYIVTYEFRGLLIALVIYDECLLQFDRSVFFEWIDVGTQESR